MRKYVKYAKLQGQDTFIPGLGSLGSTLPSPSRTLNIQMFLDSEFPTLLFVNINGSGHSVPLANVQILSFSPEESSPKAE